MKKIIIISFLCISTVIFSQKKAVQKFETDLKTIEISTEGLDDFVIENSTTNFIEIILFAENPNKQHIVFTKNKNEVQVEFQLEEMQRDETIFRKYITERLQRAHAIIKIPKEKSVTVYGGNINIESKNYQGDLNIYIEKGILKLNKIKASVYVKLYVGSVFADIKDAEINVVSNYGKIEVNDVLYEKKYQKVSEKAQLKFSVNSMKANVFLKY
jgi:hypothetical protein